MQDARRTASPSPSRDEERGIERAQQAVRLPIPVPLVLKLIRPITNEDDVAALAAQLESARARGCF